MACSNKILSFCDKGYLPAERYTLREKKDSKSSCHNFLKEIDKKVHITNQAKLEQETDTGICKNFVPRTYSVFKLTRRRCSQFLLKLLETALNSFAIFHDMCFRTCISRRFKPLFLCVTGIKSNIFQEFLLLLLFTGSMFCSFKNLKGTLIP